MPIIAKDSGGGEFTPAPEGVHQAVCVDVVDLGVIETTYAGSTKQQHKIRVMWEINEQMSDGRPFIIGRRYTLSLGEKASLRKDLQSWRGRPFTQAELMGFDVETVLGANCMVNVIHDTKDGKTWANVSAIMPLAKGMTKLQPSKDYVRMKDRQTQNGEPPPHDDGYNPSDEDVPF